MPANQSVYEYISSSVVNGCLVEGFSLDAYRVADNDLRFVDGARDGICIYHEPSRMPSQETIASIASAIETACRGDSAAGYALLAAIVNEHGAINLITAIQQATFSLQDRVSAQDVFDCAVHYIVTSPDIEMVKFGLALISPFGTPALRIQDAIHTLGLSDEFTFFACYDMMEWADGNDMIFDLAQRTRGWGRIHAVDMVEPRSDEIGDWLFHEGIHNDIMPEYSALVCYDKAEVPVRLMNPMSHEEFACATAIVGAALGDGPVEGILSLEDPGFELEGYVKQAEYQAGQQALDALDRACLARIAGIAANEGWSELKGRCVALLSATA